MKVKKTIFPIPAAAAAIPANPKSAAINATMKNPKAHFSISPPEKSYAGLKSQKFTGRWGCSSVVVSAITVPFGEEISYVVLFLQDTSRRDICVMS